MKLGKTSTCLKRFLFSFPYSLCPVRASWPASLQGPEGRLIQAGSYSDTFVQDLLPLRSGASDIRNPTFSVSCVTSRGKIFIQAQVVCE